MKVTTLHIICFLYFILCTLSMADGVCRRRRYTVDLTLDNKVSNSSLMTEHHSESLIECGVMCGEFCACFGFNLQLKECHIHQSCDSSDMTAKEAGWRYFCADDDLAVDCWDLHIKGHTRSGVYLINPTGKLCHARTVYCDMETSGGGWTVIQKREDGSTDFYRDWTDYKRGFGVPSKNYWIGNEAIHTLTKTNQELRVHLESFENQTAYAVYSTFYIGDESSKYQITVGGYSGTAGDSLGYHNKQKFTTRDQDNDARSNGNCAVQRHGAWWYWACSYSNLNALYAGSALSDIKHLVWYSWQNKNVALKGSQMMIRPKS